MNFTDIVTEVADRMNLTSTTALARIGRSVNIRYRELVSSVGLVTSVRAVATASTIVGNRSLVFGPSPIPTEKILSVYNTSNTPPLVLAEVDYDELRNMSASTDPPTRYAIQLMGSNTVTIYLGSAPATIFTLTADVISNQSTMSGLMVPNFAEDYHDILVFGGMEIEYDKMEKPALAKKFGDKYEVRLGELRLFIAKSAYKDIYQGKTGGTHVLVNRV